MSITFKPSRLTKVLETKASSEMGRNKKAAAPAVAEDMADICSYL